MHGSMNIKSTIWLCQGFTNPRHKVNQTVLYSNAQYLSIISMEHASCHPAGVFLRWLLDLWKICGPLGYGMQHMIFKHC